MTRDQARGQLALKTLDAYTEPQPYFISEGAAPKLYELERSRSALLEAIAKEWAKVAKVDKEKYWTQSIPQALHDTLESYQTECGIIAAEAFLRRHGWTITRPKAEV